MDVHKNARTTPYSRAVIAGRIVGGTPVAAVARAFGVSDRTARKWARRASAGAWALEDRSCRPARSPRAARADQVGYFPFGPRGATVSGQHSRVRSNRPPFSLMLV
jgi:hypothetical protein